TYLRQQENSFFNGHYRYLPIDGVVNNNVTLALRNVNQPKLCNGTFKKLMINVVGATILTGNFKGEDVLILRIPMIPIDTPFKFKRLQIPIRLAFAITINKAQGHPDSNFSLQQTCTASLQAYCKFVTTSVQVWNKLAAS
ncbi:hypothetical protein AVEN_83768-1, partial [Araneus ventricosus]